MKGILSKHDMIKAIRDRRKTQTRRLGGLKYINEHPEQWELMVGHDKDSVVWVFRNEAIGEVVQIKPSYQVGETVYIKEAWRVLDVDTRTLRSPIHRVKIEYKMDC